ncbi:hypothetical protein GS416_08660 [Rhodococcus hoagii]|nr:hypothetical protein [Prescottella equi]
MSCAMSQLTKLIDAASGEESIATVVRKLYVLARRAGAADLEAWAVKELNGYEASDPLPTYRGPSSGEPPWSLHRRLRWKDQERRHAVDARAGGSARTALHREVV